VPAIATASESVVSAAAWGPARRGCSDTLPSLLGGADDPAGFARRTRCCATFRVGTAACGSGVRPGAGGLVPAVLEQKVVSLEAHRAWRRLLLTFGDPAPGPAPAGMRVFPPPQTWLRIPSWEWHLAGVEAVRARTIAAAARVAGRMEEAMAMPLPRPTAGCRPCGHRAVDLGGNQAARLRRR